MPRITEAEARRLWEAEIRTRGWKRSDLAKVMFDWPPGEGGTVYHESPPVWRTIAAEHNEADRDDYFREQAELLRRGESYSRKRGGGTPTLLPDYQPIAITQAVIIETLHRAMNTLHPVAARHEQILRAKFISQLPTDQAEAIGTLTSAVHPERTTPSNDYRRTGERDTHARYDLGLGHPIESNGMVGAIELKTTDSFDQQLDGGLQADFGKLLDPLLPPSALRVSWMIAQEGTHSPDGFTSES